MLSLGLRTGALARHGRRRFCLRPVLIAIVLLTRDAFIRADDPVSSNVRYTGEIVRIFDRKCAPCHGRDGVAMPLTTYREVRDWGRAIREEIVEQRMPPWSAARGYARFRDDLALTARETMTILSWLDGGMPRGDDRDLPPARAADAAGSEPDRRLVIPPQRVSPVEEHIVRRVVIDTDLDRARTLERLVVTPGQRSVMRGALVFAGDPDTGGRWLGAWLPWQPQVDASRGGTMLLPAHARLTVELHYRGREQEVTDRPTIDLYFADRSAGPDSGAADDRVGVLDDVVVRAGVPARLAKATAIWAIVPRADASATSLELIARRPDGAVQTLLWIPDYRHEWPQALALQDPAALPAGTTLTLAVEPASASATARISRGTSSRP
jgi:hypothetical protein